MLLSGWPCSLSIWRFFVTSSAIPVSGLRGNCQLIISNSNIIFSDVLNVSDFRLALVLMRYVNTLLAVASLIPMRGLRNSLYRVCRIRRYRISGPSCGRTAWYASIKFTIALVSVDDHVCKRLSAASPARTISCKRNRARFVPCDARKTALFLYATEAHQQSIFLGAYANDSSMFDMLEMQHLSMLLAIQGHRKIATCKGNFSHNEKRRASMWIRWIFTMPIRACPVRTAMLRNNYSGMSCRTSAESVKRWIHAHLTMEQWERNRVQGLFSALTAYCSMVRWESEYVYIISREWVSESLHPHTLVHPRPSGNETCFRVTDKERKQKNKKNLLFPFLQFLLIFLPPGFIGDHKHTWNLRPSSKK